MKLDDFLLMARSVYAIDMATARRAKLFKADGEWFAYRRDPVRWLMRTDAETQARFWQLVSTRRK